MAWSRRSRAAAYVKRDMVVDREARNRLAEGIRHLAAGVITNWEFEDRSISYSTDPAIRAVYSSGAWFLYHDIMRYRLRGRYRLSPAVRREAARWVLFLKTDLPYEWPLVRPNLLAMVAWLVGNLLTLGLIARVAQRRFEQQGEFRVWPFIRRSDYEAAVAAPPFLKGPSNGGMQPTAPSGRG